MKHLKPTALGMGALMILSGCVQPPLQPNVFVMPAPNKPYQVFQEDDVVCRQMASQSVGGTAAEAAPGQQAVAGAVIGTLVGAAAGALLTPRSGFGAAPGAAMGLLAGGAIGSGQAQSMGIGTQRRYDIAYAQCMYSRGNQVPAYVMPATSLPPAMLPPGTIVPPPPAPGAYPPPQTP